MITLKGRGVFGGIAIGRLCYYRSREHTVKRRHVKDAQREIERFEAARIQAKEELQALYERAVREVGEANAMIFQIHQMMLEDANYDESVQNIIRKQGVNAEYAVGMTADNFARMFSVMDDEYMRARAADVRDSSERLLEVLEGGERRQGFLAMEEPVIIAAQDLAPSETIQLDKKMILGFVTAQGSANSHSAILARTMNIPAVVNMGEVLKPEFDGMLAVVDGFHGTVYLEPDGETLARMRLLQKEEAERRELLAQMRGKPNQTLDGRTVNLYANIGQVSDLGAALQNDAGGIGLLRSEFLYLEKEDYPTEEELFQAYKSVAENMAGKRVVIRTLDIGADKRAGYFGLPQEENPALGYRAIRICLDRPELFKTQLRAVLRASAFGNVSVMFPMIISPDEVRRAKALLQEARDELREQGIPYSEDMETGVMIETPAAALISGELAREADFFSVGTNDLTQYTLAIDRQNPKLDAICDTHHPAVLKLIRMAAENAHKNGIWIGICGELAADLELTEQFLDMGIDELSVSPSMILPLRKRVREIGGGK